MGILFSKTQSTMTTVIYILETWVLLSVWEIMLIIVMFATKHESCNLITTKHSRDNREHSITFIPTYHFVVSSATVYGMQSG